MNTHAWTGTLIASRQYAARNSVSTFQILRKPERLVTIIVLRDKSAAATCTDRVKTKLFVMCYLQDQKDTFTVMMVLKNTHTKAVVVFSTRIHDLNPASCD